MGRAGWMGRMGGSLNPLSLMHWDYEPTWTLREQFWQAQTLTESRESPVLAEVIRVRPQRHTVRELQQPQDG